MNAPRSLAAHDPEPWRRHAVPHGGTHGLGAGGDVLLPGPLAGDRRSADAGARYLFAAGDITAKAVPLDLSRAVKLLNRFGRHQRALSTDQFEWFRSELAKHQNQPMMVFGRHPLIVKESSFPITPRNTLDTMQTATVLGDDARARARSCTTPATPIATSEP